MPIDYSIIVSTRDPDSPEVDWHRRQAGERVESIIVANSGRWSLGQAYNEGLRQAQGEFCCFIHDDARVWSPGWLDRLAQVVTQDAVDLVGVAGTTKMPRSGGWWDSGRGFGRGRVAHLHDNGQLVLDDYGPPDDAYRGLSPVVSLDGLLLFGRRRDFASAPFDTELFDGFHFYDSDLSLRWLLWYGRRLAVVHGLDVVHRTGASLENWQTYLNRFHYRHGGFLPLSLADVEVWRDNIAALRHQDPPAAARLTSGRRPGLVLGFASQESGSTVAKTEHGDQPLRDQPLDEVPEPHRDWIVLQGAGTGERLDQLLRDDTRPIWVVEPQAHLICWLFCRYNWAEEIYSGRLHWLIPAVDQPAVAEVGLHEIIGGLQQLIADRGPPGWIKSGSYALAQSFHDQVESASMQCLATVARIERWPSSVGSTAVTVISPRCRIFDDLANSLSAIGCPTRRIEVPDRPADWTRLRYWHTLRQLRDPSTDVTIVRNRAFLETADASLRLGIERFVPGRIVSWWWDEPTVSTALDLRDPSYRRPALAFARGLLSQLPPGSRWLPPAARSEFVRPQPHFGNDGRDWPLSFVGQSRFHAMRDHLNILANALAYFDGRIGPQLAQEINGASTMRGFHETLVRLAEPTYEAIARIRCSLPAVGIYLETLRRMAETAAFRLAAVEALKAFPLIVFGDEGWVESGAVERDRFAGLVSPADLPALYRRTQLNLNFNFMQVSTTVNPKVLDIAAGGHAVLTDDRPELGELFVEPETRPPSFANLAELPDRVSALLASDLSTQREAMCRVVRSQHTMNHRARWIAREYGLPMQADATDDVA